MKEMKRQRRRRDIIRVRERAKRIYQISLGGYYIPDCGKYREALTCYLKHAEYLAVCSCSMCGNPRKKMRGQDNRTLQEIRFDYRLTDE